MRRYKLILAFLISVTGALGMRASASPTYSIVDWFPYGWMEDGQPRGMLVEIARAADRALGITNQYTIAPVSRVLRSLKTGEYDFSIIYRGEKLNSEVDHLLDVGCISTAVMSLKTAPVLKLADMNKKRVAYSGNGYFHDRYLPTLNATGMQIANTDIMFRMMFRGRVDAFVIDDAVLQGYRNNLHPSYKIPEGDWDRFAAPFYLDSLRLALSTSYSPRYAAMKARMRDLMYQDEFLEELQVIYLKYGLPGGTACLHLSN